MNLPNPPVLRAEDFPETEPRLLETVSTGFRDQAQALGQVPNVVIKTGSFVSAASGVTTVDVKNPLPSKPRHVSLALRREDLADFTAAWSWWFVVSGEQIRFRFVSLPASTRHVYSIEVL